MQLSVEVTIATALRRNASRERRVPEAVLRDYGALRCQSNVLITQLIHHCCGAVRRVPMAMEALREEEGMLDELITWNNE